MILLHRQPRHQTFITICQVYVIQFHYVRNVNLRLKQAAKCAPKPPLSARERVLQQSTATAFGLGSFRGFLQNQGNLRGPPSPLFFIKKMQTQRSTQGVCLHGSPEGVFRQPPPVPSLSQAIGVYINLGQEATKQTCIEPFTH